MTPQGIQAKLVGMSENLGTRLTLNVKGHKQSSVVLVLWTCPHKFSLKNVKSIDGHFLCFEIKLIYMNILAFKLGLMFVLGYEV